MSAAGGPAFDATETIPPSLLRWWAVSGSVTIRDGLATLGGMATTPRPRRRGVQTALVAHRLRYAAELGGDLARVGADPDTISERNVQRARFSIGYNQLFMRGPEVGYVGGS